MKDRAYTNIICKGFCRFYKEGREELHCGTYNFLRRNLTPNELTAFLKRPENAKKSPVPDFSRDKEIKEIVCDGCEFLMDGCDFREDGSHPPCGGYILLERLLG